MFGVPDSFLWGPVGVCPRVITGRYVQKQTPWASVIKQPYQTQPGWQELLFAIIKKLHFSSDCLLIHLSFQSFQKLITKENYGNNPLVYKLAKNERSIYVQEIDSVLRLAICIYRNAKLLHKTQIWSNPREPGKWPRVTRYPQLHTSQVPPQIKCHNKQVNTS